MVHPKKVHAVVASIAILGVLISSSSTGSAKSDEISFEIGMSMKEVRKLMGRPESRASRVEDDAWLYMVGPRIPVNRCEYHTFWFRDEMLIGITTRQGDLNKQCEVVGRIASARFINWSQMPDPP